MSEVHLSRLERAIREGRNPEKAKVFREPARNTCLGICYSVYVCVYMCRYSCIRICTCQEFRYNVYFSFCLIFHFLFSCLSHYLLCVTRKRLFSRSNGRNPGRFVIKKKKRNNN